MLPRHVRFANLAAAAVSTPTLFDSVVKAVISATENPYIRNSYGAINVAGKYTALRNWICRFDSLPVWTGCEASLQSLHMAVAMHRCENDTLVRLVHSYILIERPYPRAQRCERLLEQRHSFKTKKCRERTKKCISSEVTKDRCFRDMSCRHVATCLQDTQCLLFLVLWKKFLLKTYAAKLKRTIMIY